MCRFVELKKFENCKQIHVSLQGSFNICGLRLNNQRAQNELRARMMSSTTVFIIFSARQK